MRIPPGTRLGPYEVVGPVGAGGMGQVYRARDTRLGRDVAIKVIAADQEPTAEQRQRFDREARAIAQLSHPNVCTLFDVGHDQGIGYIVIELLDGETLASRLERGPLPIEECFTLGARMASALAAAHARGIVHRDLKPANVMLTRTGPKLLDFGLAKSFGPTPELSGEATETAAAKLTGTGMLIGTVPYMAPEQIEGRQPDARTDIFALGAVLYEMATGKPAFSAHNPVALVAAVLASDPPPLSTVRPGAPPSLDRLIRRCLAKDPAERWHSAHDIALQLQAITDDARERTPESRRRMAQWLQWLPWALTAGALAVAAISLARSASRPRGEAATIRFTIDPPAGGGFVWNTETNSLAMSPDGQTLAFIAFDSTGEQKIWLRPLSSTVSTPLQGTQDAQSLMWSPDGQAIAFFTSDRLQRIDLPDGAPVTLTQLASRAGQSGTWGRAGHILFAGVQGEAIYRVPSSGGAPEVVLRPDTTVGEARLSFPWYLPDGSRFLYTLRRTDGSSMLMQTTVGQRPRLITNVESLVQYSAPGVLAFVRDGTLLGQAFDANEGRVEGEPFAVADGTRYFLSTGATAMATSEGGTLAFHPAAEHQELLWLDRAGQQIGDAVSSGSFLDATLSPEGNRVLVARQQLRLGTWDMWMLDLERATETRLTTSRLTEVYGLWLPGGRTIIYSTAVGGPPVLVRRELDSTVETRLLDEPHFQIAVDLSPDARTLLYRRRPGGGTWDIWTLPIDGDGKPSAWLETPFTETDARFSPDGRYVAVVSDETGRPELYVTPFPGPGEKTRVSTGGARLVRWPRRSGEIIYVTQDGRMMAVPVQTQPTLRVGTPVTLFSTDARSIWGVVEVTPDAQRFLVTIPVVIASRQPLTVVTNWAAAAR